MHLRGMTASAQSRPVICFLIAGAVAAPAAALTVTAAKATADPCTVTVTLVGGKTLSFTVDLPAGTPVSAINLPVKLAVANVSASCTPVVSAPVAAPPSAAAPVAAGPVVSSRAPKVAGHGRRQPRSSGSPPVVGRRHVSGRARPRSRSGAAVVPASAPAATPLRGNGGVPSLTNPTASFALPGPAPLGVPNFFIDNFAIPPFLLPIYQAAGIEYSVPWQVLAAINEVETNYGRNLSVSTAGAVGWMQFLPSTWKQWGQDANGDGVRDPYNPVDAIFSAGRYLQAAGASKDLGKAIFAYNHAGWYVQEVLLRAKLIGGMPSSLVGALTGLVQGHFPVAAAAKYADDSVEALATRRVRGRNAAIAIGSDHSQGVNIFAAKGSPLIAVNDGKIVAVGRSGSLGRFIRLQDQTGNIYTYSQLGSVAARYAVPKVIRESQAQIRAQLASTPPPAAAPMTAASAGAQKSFVSGARALAAAAARVSRTLAHVTRSLPQATPAAVLAGVKQRLFAHPSRSASYAAGGAQQLASVGQQLSSFRSYFTSTLHLARNQYRLAPLRRGAIVVAGTVLGRVGGPGAKLAPHIRFQIQPAGQNAPFIDPKVILDGWKLLEATAVYRANGQDPFLGRNASVGQMLLMSKDELEQRVLTNPHVKIYSCGLRDITAGLVDRRVLAVIEYLSASGLDPTVSGLVCGNSSGASGSSVNITALDGIPVAGHQGPGSVTDMAIRRLLTLQGAAAPTMIVSLMSYKDQSNTLALPDHADRLQITYRPQYGANKQLSAAIKSALKPTQWINLIQRIGQIPEPVVPITPSSYAIEGAAN